MSDTFDRAFVVVVGAEGGLSLVRADRGNWTGGSVGSGELRGTKYGISAAAYPTLDIQSLSLDDAKTIYKKYYWDKIRGDDLPPPVALTVFDAGVMSGPASAARWLQQAACVAADGVIGPATLAAVAKRSVLDLVSEINARRMMLLTTLDGWETFGLGWTRRITHLSVAAVGFDTAPVVSVQTINPAPVVASLDDVRTVVREIMAKVAA